MYIFFASCNWPAGFFVTGLHLDAPANFFMAYAGNSSAINYKFADFHNLLSA